MNTADGRAREVENLLKEAHLSVKPSFRCNDDDATLVAASAMQAIITCRPSIC
jgi:hypothetical protein